VDGGINFTVQSSGTTSDIHDIEFMNRDTGFAVGVNGTLLRTFNGGLNWNSVYSGTNSISRVSFNGNIVFCSTRNGLILKSTNYGNSWSTISNSSTGTVGTIYDIVWTSPSIGYFVEWGNIRKTTNGGSTWSPLPISGVSGVNILSISFIDANNGIAVGGTTSSHVGYILKTSDAGLTWTSQTYNDHRFSNVEFLNSSVCYIAGGTLSSNTSTILKTKNGGISWSTAGSSSYRQLNLSFPSFNVGYSCGLDGSVLKIKIDSIPVDTTIIIDTAISVSCETAIVMPNVFSPNGDGINDFFKPVAVKCVDDLELTIFNRWGQMIYLNNNSNLSWDGNNNSKLCSEDTYYWVLKYTDDKKEKIIKKGYLTLIR